MLGGSPCRHVGLFCIHLLGMCYGEVISLRAGGEQYLWYKAPKKVDVAILRATTADVDGNVTFEKEAMVLDCQNQARNATGTLRQCFSSLCPMSLS